MAAAEAPVRSAAFVRLRARRGLAIYSGILIPLSALIQVLLIKTGQWGWVIPLIWSRQQRR